MTDEDKLALTRFMLDRFCGFVPDSRMLLYAIRDWETEMNNHYKGQEDGE